MRAGYEAENQSQRFYNDRPLFLFALADGASELLAVVGVNNQFLQQDITACAGEIHDDIHPHRQHGKVRSPNPARSYWLEGQEKQIQKICPEDLPIHLTRHLQQVMMICPIRAHHDKADEIPPDVAKA